jgi:hypothetical protein
VVVELLIVALPVPVPVPREISLPVGNEKYSFARSWEYVESSQWFVSF